MLIDGIVASAVSGLTLPGQGSGNVIITNNGDYIRFQTGERKAWSKEVDDIIILLDNNNNVITSRISSINFTLLSGSGKPDIDNEFSDAVSIDATEELIYVLDVGLQAIIVVDPENGRRTILSSPTVPDNVNIIPVDSTQVIAAEGFVFVLGNTDYLLKIDSVTGARERIDYTVTIPDIISADYGIGTRDIFILNGSGVDYVFAFNLDDETTRLVSNNVSPGATNPVGRKSIVYDSDNNRLIVVDQILQSFFYIAIGNGAKTEVSSADLANANNATGYFINKELYVSDQTFSSTLVFDTDDLAAAATEIQDTFLITDSKAKRLPVSDIEDFPDLYFSNNNGRSFNLVGPDYAPGKTNTTIEIFSDSSPASPAISQIREIDIDLAENKVYFTSVSSDFSNKTIPFSADLTTGVRTALFDPSIGFASGIIKDASSGVFYVGSSNTGRLLYYIDSTETAVNNGVSYGGNVSLLRDYRNNYLYQVGVSGIVRHDVSSPGTFELFASSAEGVATVQGCILEDYNNRLVFFRNNQTSIYALDLDTKALTILGDLGSSGSQYFKLTDDPTRNRYLLTRTTGNTIEEINKTSFNKRTVAAVESVTAAYDIKLAE